MRGFIGPIGDDLPSILAILLALSIFFSGLTFALNTYNQRLESFNQLKGAMDIARKVTADGLISSSTTATTLVTDADPIARSYGIDFCVEFNGIKCSVGTSCKDEWIKLNYLVAYKSPMGKIKLTEMRVCAG